VTLEYCKEDNICGSYACHNVVLVCVTHAKIPVFLEGTKMKRKSVAVLLLAFLAFASMAEGRLYWEPSEIELQVGEEKVVQICCDEGRPGDYTIRMGASGSHVAGIVDVTCTYLAGSLAEEPEWQYGDWWVLKDMYGTELLWCVGPHWEVRIRGLRPGAYELNSDYYEDEGTNDNIPIRVGTCTLSEAVDNTTFSFTTGGSANWFGGLAPDELRHPFWFTHHWNGDM